MIKTNCPNVAKKLFILLIVSLVFVFFVSPSVYALTAETINFQGKIVRNDTGYEGLNVVPGSPACVVDGAGNDTCDFRVSYYTASSGGTLLLTEDYTNIEIGQYDGVFELSLGSGTVTTSAQCRDGTCNNVVEVLSEYNNVYIELKFAPDGTNLTETFSRMPLEASAYSIYSKYAGGSSDAFKFSNSISTDSQNNPVAGMVYFDPNDSELKVYDGSAWTGIGSGSELWTDAGTFTHLTSTTDDILFGGNTIADATFFFDVDGSSGSYLEIDNAANTDRLFTILSGGNVGIGVITPTSKLEVAGSSSTISNSAGDLTITTGGDNGDIVLMPHGTGKVGIGTATPGQMLSVAGTFGIIETGTTPTYYTVFQGGDQSSNVTYTLPTSPTDGLLRNTGGTWSWDNTAYISQAYTTVQEEGVGVTQRSILNFVGSGFTAADEGANTRTNISLDLDLNALADLATTGIVTRTGANTYTTREVAGTTDRISVTNGTGVSGNPTVDIASTYVGQTSITTLGTISTGTWNATEISAVKGGTGQTSYVIGDLLYASSTTVLSRRAIGTTGQVLTVTGGVPTWETPAATHNPVSQAAIGGTPNQYGYTITAGQVLNLEPASASFGGVVTTAAQTFAGNKSFDGTLAIKETGTTPTYYTTFQGGDQSGNVTYTLPISSTNGVLRNSNGTLSWDSSSFVTQAYSTIQEEGGNLTQRSILNFVGSGFTAADDGVNTRTNITMDSDLNALADLTTTGMMARTAADTYTMRTITGTTGTISVTNGTGVSGNPTITIDANYLGQTSITTLGTIGTGTWQGQVIDELYGGTGFNTYATGDMIYASAANTLSKRAIGTPGQVLTVTGGVPTWETPAATHNPVSQAAIGGTPNQYGYTITAGQVLNLEPASASFGGVVTTAAQTFAGNKSFDGTLAIKETGTTPTYYTTFQGGDQSGNVTYTLPVSSTNGLLRNTGGVWSWDSTAYISQAYTTIQEEGGVGLTQRSILNFVGSGFTAADDGTNTRTNITMDSDLNALADLTTTGMMARTAANTYTMREVAGTTDRVTITNGTGVSGNPTVDIASTYIGQTSITTLGTITTGTWSATEISAIKGGTGQTGYAIGDILYASSTTALSKRTIGTTGQVLTVTGGVPVWQDLPAGMTIWTDAGTFTYLTSASDDLVLGATTVADATFFFDVDGASGSYFEIDDASNTNRLFTILSGGNVGIGVSNPTSKLEVAGAASTISSSSGDLTLLTGGDNGDILLKPHGTGRVGILESGTTPTYYTYLRSGDQSGDIEYTLPTTSTNGVLTNTAGVLSWASGSSSALSAITAATATNSINNGDYQQVWNWSLTTASNSAFTFGENAASTATGTPAILVASTVANSTAIPLYVKNYGNAPSFRVDDVSGDTTPFIIDASGNVGIGISSPERLLHVNGATVIGGDPLSADLGNLHVIDTDQTVAAFERETNVVSNTINIDFYGNHSTGGDARYGSIGAIIEDNAAGAHRGGLVFYSSSTSLTERMRITGVGNVGIGTNSPSGRLHSSIPNTAVTTTQYTGYFENLATNTTTDAINKYGMYITSTGTFTGLAGTATNNYGLYVNTPAGADNNYAAIFAGGNVGVGTTSPDFALQVNGVLAPETTDQDLGTTSLRWDLYGNTIDADSTVTLTGIGTGEDNTVVILNSSNQLTTDEIDSRVWGATLLNGSALTQNYLTKTSSTTNQLVNSMVYDNGTSVGIGTASPSASYKLDIVGSVHVASNYSLKMGGTGGGIRIWGTENSGYAWDGFVGRGLYYDGTDYRYQSTNSGSYWGTNAGMWVKGSGTNAMQFIARPATESGVDIIATDLDTYTRLTIQYGGNIGIGTVSPSSKLEVNGGVELTNLYDTAAATGDNFFDGGCSSTQTMTGIDSTGAISCTSITGFDNYVSWTARADTGTDQPVTSGYILDFAGTTNEISTSIVANQITFGIPDDGLDFTEFQDTLDLDNDLIVNQAGYTWTQNFTGTTLTGLTYNANSLTSGMGVSIASTATGLTNTLAKIALSGSNVANTGSVLTLENSGTLNTGTTLLINHYATGTNNLAMRVNDVSGDTTPFVIDGGGNVGIGDITPGGRLEISPITALNEKAIVLTNNATANVDESQVVYSIYSTLSPNSTGAMLGAQTWAFGLYNTGTATGAAGGAARLYGLANYNIATTADSYAYGTYYLSSASSTGGTQYAHYADMTSGTATKWGLYITGEANNYLSGNLGIGTVSPSSKLEVNGGVELTNLYDTAAATGDNFFDGGCSATQTVSGIDSTGAISCTTISGVSTSFTNITSGTNTQAAMVVGVGASLTYHDGVATSGEINASLLQNANWAAPLAIGSTTANTGAFTTLTSSGNTTIGDAVGDTVTSNSGAWTFTNATTVALNNSANSLNFDSNTLSIDALNNRVGIGTTAPSTLLQLGTAGTRAGTLSLAGGTSGLVTIDTLADAGTWTLTLPSDDGTLSGQVLTTDGNGNTSWTTVATGSPKWNAITSPDADYTLNHTQYKTEFTFNTFTSGSAFKLSSNSTAGIASSTSTMLEIARSGANTNLAHTAYGIYSTVTNTNATSGTNIAGYFSASGATTANYGLIVAAGNVGIGTATPSNELEVVGDVELTNLYDNDSTNFFDGGCSSTQTMTGIDSTGAISCTSITGFDNYVSWTARADTGTDQPVTSGYILDFAGTTNEISTSIVANQITFGIPDDGLDFTEFQDTLDLDNDLIVNQAGYTWTQNFTGTILTGLTYNANSLTSGNGISLSSTATTGLTGNLLNVSGSLSTGSGSLVGITANSINGNGNALKVTTSTTGALTTGLLYVNATGAASGTVAQIGLNNTVGAASASVLTLTNSYTSNTGTTLLINHYATGANNLAMRVNDVSGDTTPFVIDGGGNVGIGTATPSNELEVVGDVELTNLYDNDATNFFDGGCSATQTVSGIDSTGAISCTTISGVSTSFTNITSGTNTQAAMVVGVGASLTYHDGVATSGEINASLLQNANWAAPLAIGSTTANTGAFTTLTSSGNTTLGTGASSVNVIGSTTTPGTLTLHGATTLDNTFTVSGNNLTSLGGNLAVTGNVTSQSYVQGTSLRGGLYFVDDRSIAPADFNANEVNYVFTAYGNNNASPWADGFVLRSYGDATGGSDNMLTYSRSSISARMWQQTYGSATAFSTYEEFAFTGTGGTANYVPKYTDANTIGNSSIYDNGTSVGIKTASPSASTLLQLGAAGTQGTLGIAGSTSGLVIIDTLAAAGTWTLTLPADDGAPSQVLTTDGNGNTSWTTSSSSSALSAITAATTTNTINSGNNGSQIWNWSLTTASSTAFTFGENTASTGAGTTILSAATLANSTAIPFYVKNYGNAVSFRVDDVSGDTTPFVIDVSGNVGIGTATPTAPLDITGVNSRVGNTTGDLAIFTGGGNGNILLQPNGTGKVGIIDTGATPTHYTYIQGGDQSADVTYTLPTGAPSVSGYVLSATTAGVMSWIQASSSSALSSITAATTTNTINSGNNGGQVWNWALTTASTTAFTFGENTASSGASTTILSVATVANSTATPLYVKNYGNAASFRVDDVSGDTTPFVIDANGNVGVGTDTMAGRLTVYTSNTAVTTTQYSAFFENTATNTTTDGINKYGLYITSTGTFTGSIGTATNNYGLYVGTPTGADNNYAAIFAGGNVGIGEAAPASLFTVGSGGTFQVNTDGDLIRVKGVTYSWPTGNANGSLLNDGSGVLSWGAPSVTVPLSSITAATATNTISSGDNGAQVWNWSLTTAGRTAFTFGESAASTATGTPAILTAETVANSTAIPLYVKNYGNAASFRVDDVSGDTSSFLVDASGNVGIGSTVTTSKLTVNNDNTLYSTIELQYNGTPVVDIFSNVTSNIFIGLDSGSAISSGTGNIALGYNTLLGNTTGLNNTAIGHQSLSTNVAKQGSTAVGYQAMMYADNTVTAGLTYNTAVGYQALTGSGAAGSNTGTSNTAIGHQSLTGNTSGGYNTAVGVNTLNGNTTGTNNVAIGHNALFSNVAKQGSVAIGYDAMRYANSSATGSQTYNTAIGKEALMGSTTPANNTGIANTAVGQGVLMDNTSGNYNTGVGMQALIYNTTGLNNTALGVGAMAYNSVGDYNTALGMSALYNNQGKRGSVAVGYEAMYYADDTLTETVTQNTAIGYQALKGGVTPSANTGTGNTVLGYQAGDGITSGSNNILIGANVDTINPVDNSQLNIGNSIYGDLSNDYISIGDSTPTEAMFTVGATSQFRVSSIGDLTRIKDVPYAWPSANAAGALINNGSGTLSWTAVPSGSGSGTASAGQVTFWNGTSSVTGNNNFWWDNTNVRLGIGTSSPAATLDIGGATSRIANASGDITIDPAGNLIIASGSNVGIGVASPTAVLDIAGATSEMSNTVGDLTINPAEDLVIPSGKKIGVGTATPSAYLDLSASTSTTTGDVFGSRIDITKTTSGAQTVFGYRVNAGVTHTSGSLSGVQVNSTIMSFTGNGGTTSYAEGLTSAATVSTGAIVSNMSMIKVFSPNNSGTIENLKGIYLSNISAGSTTNFSIYSEGGAMYHAGNITTSSSGNLGLGLGTTTPAIDLAIGDSDTGFNWVSDGVFNVYVNNSAKATFNSTGLGIGVTPSYALHVSGTSYLGGTIYTAGSEIELTTGLTGNRYSYIDFHGDDTYTDYGLRVIRENTGVNTTSAIYHRGTGSLLLNAVDAGAIGFLTSSTTRMTITSGGYVNVGSYLSMYTGVAGTPGMQSIRGSNTSGNLVVNAYSAGITFVNWDSGTGGFVVGNGASAEIYRIAGSSTYNRGRIYSQASDATANSTDANGGMEIGIYRYAVGISSNSIYQYYSNASSVAYKLVTTGTAMDLAEWYPVGDIDLDSNGNSTIKKGELLCLDTQDATKVVRCDSEHTDIMGIVSTASFTTMGQKDMDDLREDDVEVALTGRVPAIVTSKNGAIAIGDYITYSDLRGVGQKAIKRGQVVAKALDTFNPSSCTPASSLESINWPVDPEGDNPTKPCYRLPDGTFVGKIMVLPNISTYDPSETYTTERIVDSGWYRIAQLNGPDDYAKLTINNTSIGSSQNLILSVDTVGDKENINVISNFTTGGYNISQSRVNTVEGVKYLEVYLEQANDNNFRVHIDGNITNWITTSITRIDTPTLVNEEYAFNGLLFGVSETLEVGEGSVNVNGNLLTTSGNLNNIGDTTNRWNDIYAKGAIRLGSGVGQEGAIRFNVEKQMLEFSNDGETWVQMGDLGSQIVLSPEYPGAILFADSTDNYGSMTSDAEEAVGGFKNYYEWVSDRSTPQDYDILVRVTLPSDFVSWKDDAILLDFMTENSDSLENNKVDMYLIGKNGVDAQVDNGISTLPGGWERVSIKGLDINDCNTAGDTCTLRISVTSSQSYFVRVGDITLNYNRGL